MDQHPIPRQITTFEFKLIGFMTLKQFIYIIIFCVIGFIVYGLTPIPYLNILLAIITTCIGFALAFLPINDRSLDVWVKNLIKRLTSPTQYIFKKENPPPIFLLNVSLTSPPHIVATHIDAKDKLSEYLRKNQSQSILINQQKKQKINQYLVSPISYFQQNKSTQKTIDKNINSSKKQNTSFSTPKTPFLTGIVRNYKSIPLPGVLIYIKKTENSQPIRILKTNNHGVFLTFNPLPEDNYIFQIKDTKQQYNFDTIKLRIEKNNQKPIEIFSKELL